MELQIISPLHKANRQVSLYFEAETAKVGLSPVEGHLLAFVGVYSPSPIAELVRVLGLKHSTLSSMLDRLERDGLLSREVNPEDRRSFVVSLTVKGTKRARHMQGHAEELEQRIRDCISEKDLTGYHAVLAAIGTTTNVEVREKK